MARELSGEASEDESRQLQAFLLEHPEAQHFFEVFSDYWKPGHENAEDDIQEEIHFQQILAIAEKEEAEEAAAIQDPPERTGLPRIGRLAMAAACIVAVISLGLIYFGKNSAAESGTAMVNEIVARAGARSYFLLPDGSRVWLNSESRLEYKTNFNDTLREVVLEGEAFFDVVADKTRPFIVHTSDVDVRVLGTAFNVKSYPDESSIEATLIHGMIEITNKKEPSSPKLILRPHEKVVFNKVAELPPGLPVEKHAEAAAHKPFSITALPKNLPDSAVVETSWVYNKLVFDGETFREIAAKMERWYNKKIIFRNEKVAEVPIHVTFRDETIEEALAALRLIESFTYKINGNEIEIL
jgi:ferric-dicitrate binding protein FerR (iron transport regulator)